MLSVLILSHCLFQSLASSELKIFKEFDAFKEKFKRVYSSPEESYRYQVFKSNLAYIDSINSQGHSFKLGIGPYADLTYEEFESQFLNPRAQSLTAPEEFMQHVELLNTTSLPQSINWQGLNKVTPAQDQGNCSCSYIFAAAASVESARAIKFKTSVVPISEQQILDCSDLGGCNGGWGFTVFDYLMTNNCIVKKSDYKYMGIEDDCKKIKSHKKCTRGDVKDWKAVIPNNEMQLMAAVSMKPVDAAVYFDPAMQHYAYGVIPRAWCNEAETNPNYEVLLFGYGVFNGTDYWIGKNSLGPYWGIGGYFMIERNPANDNSPGTCLIASQASYPIIAS